MLRPKRDYLIAVLDKEEEKTRGGLYIPDQGKEKRLTAVVRAIGPDVNNVKIGERIVFGKYNGDEFMGFIILKEEEVFASVEEDRGN